MLFTICIDEAGRHKAAFQTWAALFPSHLIKPCHLFSNHSHVSLIYGGVSSAVIHLSFSALHCFYNPPPTLHLHLDAGPSSIKSLDRKSHQVVKVHSSSSSASPLQPLTGSWGILQLQIIAGSVQKQFHLRHHVFHYAISS